MKPSPFASAWQSFVDFLSAEFVLKNTLRNGGAAILLRALLVSVELYAATLILKNAIDPGRTWRPNMVEAQTEVLTTLPWLGAMFAAVYASFYARFAAQWSYLAGLYNQIKQTEATASSDLDAKTAIAEWKAGFIEDAEELQLAGKPLFASVIRVWSKDSNVRDAYERHTIRGKERLAQLLELANRVCGDGSTPKLGEPAANVAGSAARPLGEERERDGDGKAKEAQPTS